MHMADALVSPAVGAAMWGISAGMIGYCSSRVKKNLDDRTVPLMGVLGAFVFAAQMINFTIPATGSSGHLGGGLLLAILLGPSAAFLTIASILTVQALFFADGGLLALGCNIFNMGLLPCLVAYPLVYKPISGKAQSQTKIFTGSLIASIIGLQLGSLGVVFQTLLSGISELPLRSFILFMQPIHLAIGTIEGLATASIVLFIFKARPDILQYTPVNDHSRINSMRKPAILFICITLLTGCGLSLFASKLPDGLEWSVFKTAGTEEVNAPQYAAHDTLSKIQKKTAVLPGYDFENPVTFKGSGFEKLTHPVVNHTGTSLSGFVGSIITLLFASLIGILLKRKKTIIRNN